MSIGGMRKRTKPEDLTEELEITDVKYLGAIVNDH